MKLPGVLLHAVSPSQPPLFVAHSSISVQVVSPVPEYPSGQDPQVRPPDVFVHVASAAQPPLFVAHSSSSVQLAPSDASV